MCNIGDLLLAIGLFINHRVLIRVAGLWVIPGLFLWWNYVVREWFTYPALDWKAVASSTLVHIGSLVVGLLALRRVRVDSLAWLYAFAWYLGVQFVSRLITPPALNVNVSHHTPEGWQTRFSSYWEFWLVGTLAVALCLWVLGYLFRRLWPAEQVTKPC
jgi:hypothetical protein